MVRHNLYDYLKLKKREKDAGIISKTDFSRSPSLSPSLDDKQNEAYAF